MMFESCERRRRAPFDSRLTRVSSPHRCKQIPSSSAMHVTAISVKVEFAFDCDGHRHHDTTTTLTNTMHRRAGDPPGT